LKKAILRPVQKCSIITLFDVEPLDSIIPRSEASEPYQDADNELFGLEQFERDVTPSHVS
jgi:hypothetical protein